MDGISYNIFCEVVIFVKWNDVIKRLQLISGPIKERTQNNNVVHVSGVSISSITSGAATY